jgi:SPOR domain
MITLTRILLCFSWLLPLTSVAAHIDSTEKTKTVVIHADPRLDNIVKKNTAYKSANNGVVYSGSGYRVQIYSGNERDKAIAAKVAFSKKYPNIKSYITYVTPQFRVKVGDYRSRAEAQNMYQELSKLFTPCMIVSDAIVIINTL